MFFRYSKKILLLASFVGLCVLQPVWLAAQSPVSYDLSEHDFEKIPAVALDGEWQFYWMQFIDPSTSFDRIPPADTLLNFTTKWNTIDGFSSKGYATYIARVILPENHPPMALDIPDFYTSYTLYINGSEFSKNGVVATRKDTYKPKWQPLTKSLNQLDADTLDLVLQVANFVHSKGGTNSPILIGPEELLLSNQLKNYGYSFFLAGALLMGGMFFLGLYLFGRHELPILYFSIFSMVYSYRIIGVGSYALHLIIQNAPWIVTARLEYISLFLSGYIFGMYTLSLYPKETPKTLIYILSGISVLFIAITLFLPAHIFTQLAQPYTIVLPFYLIIALGVYIKAVANNQPGAIYSLLSFGIIFLVFAYEILVYFGFMRPSLWFSFVGYVFFFFFQSLVLSYRFADNLKMALAQAEESLKAKSQFLSTMSHEIRTPLNAVIGLSGLLSESKLTEIQREFANTIKKSGESLLSIINNILDYSKIESGKIEIEETEFNLIETVELVLDVVSSANQNPNLELLYTYTEDIPDYIVGDSTRVQQVLTNLVANAVKFTSQGEVLVAMSVVEKHYHSLVIEFKVQDTGIGIPQDKMDRLFRSFTQVDASSTRKYGGTGLGLAISKRLVEAMGGKISVSSTANEGSTFTFTITAGTSTRKIETRDHTHLQDKKVFILDDNPTNLKILEAQLAKANVTVTSFLVADQLIKHIDTLNSYDLGILDLQMPDQDGVEIAQSIRKVWSNKELPLVLFSSVHELEDLNHKKLFDLYLKKPIQQTKLLNNLERIFSSPKRESVQKKEEPTSGIINKKFSILLAEDNLINQKVAHRILQHLGVEADIAVNGKKAVNMAKAKDYDLIFMDMEMPVLDGLEATRMIKEVASMEHPAPIIVAMTANAMKEDRERCFRAGMDDFISKPITIESTKRVLKKWLADD